MICHFPELKVSFFQAKSMGKKFILRIKRRIPFNLNKFAGKVFLDESLKNIFYLIAFTVKMKDCTISTNLDHCGGGGTVGYSKKVVQKLIFEVL